MRVSSLTGVPKKVLSATKFSHFVSIRVGLGAFSRSPPTGIVDSTLVSLETVELTHGLSRRDALSQCDESQS